MLEYDKNREHIQTFGRPWRARPQFRPIYIPFSAIILLTQIGAIATNFTSFWLHVLVDARGNGEYNILYSEMNVSERIVVALSRQKEERHLKIQFPLQEECWGVYAGII